jgi:PAS domain S-box-containing protein
MRKLTPLNIDSELAVSPLLSSLANHIDAMLAFWDINEVCIYANRAYYNWFGLTQEQVIGLSLKELLGPIYQQNKTFIDAALSGEPQKFEREIPNPEGKICHSITSYIPYIPDGEILGFLSMLVMSRKKNSKKNY